MATDNSNVTVQWQFWIKNPSLVVWRGKWETVED